MDGNGRWAARRGLPRVEGHRRGVEALRRAVRAADRSRHPLSHGLQLLVRELAPAGPGGLGPHGPAEALHPQRPRRPARQQRAGADHRRAREGFAADIRALLDEAEDLTRHNTGLTLVVAFNYGGRQEIVRRRARRSPTRSRPARSIPTHRRRRRSSGQLDTAGIPDPDLVIRTSGEQRVSNFLTWQAAYAEFVFMPGLLARFRRRDVPGGHRRVLPAATAASAALSAEGRLTWSGAEGSPDASASAARKGSSDEPPRTLSISRRHGKVSSELARVRLGGASLARRPARDMARRLAVRPVLARRRPRRSCSSGRRMTRVEPRRIRKAARRRPDRPCPRLPAAASALGWRARRGRGGGARLHGRPQPRDRSWAVAGFALRGGDRRWCRRWCADSPAGGLVGVLWMFAVVWTHRHRAPISPAARFGGPKLWPRVSPKKTWSGFLGGLRARRCAVAIAGGASRPPLVRAVQPALVVLLSAAASVRARLAILLESAMKRHFDVKDSSQLIPGHGGVMDRLDAFWAVALYACVMLAWLVNAWSRADRAMTNAHHPRRDRLDRPLDGGCRARGRGPVPGRGGRRRPRCARAGRGRAAAWSPLRGAGARWRRGRAEVGAVRLRHRVRGRRGQPCWRRRRATRTWSWRRSAAPPASRRPMRRSSRAAASRSPTRKASSAPAQAFMRGRPASRRRDPAGGFASTTPSYQALGGRAGRGRRTR